MWELLSILDAIAMYNYALGDCAGDSSSPRADLFSCALLACALALKDV